MLRISDDVDGAGAPSTRVPFGGGRSVAAPDGVDGGAAEPRLVRPLQRDEWTGRVFPRSAERARRDRAPAAAVARPTTALALLALT
jgi:hypothetical protein